MKKLLSSLLVLTLTLGCGATSYAHEFNSKNFKCKVPKKITVEKKEKPKSKFFMQLLKVACLPITFFCGYEYGQKTISDSFNDRVETLKKEIEADNTLLNSIYDYKKAKNIGFRSGFTAGFLRAKNVSSIFEIIFKDEKNFEAKFDVMLDISEQIFNVEKNFN